MPVLDAGPLIHLAKLDALDVLDADEPALVPPAVLSEVVRPELAYRYPETALLDGAVRSGLLTPAELETGERELVADLAMRVAGLHAGELEVLAIASSRSIAACLHERAAIRLAAAMDIPVVHVMELLFDGTPDTGMLVRRITDFAKMTRLDIDQTTELLRRAGER
jgi:hypothetical protein